MELYRLCSARYVATAFTGLGASLAGGRWNDRGLAMVYTASSLSLAALECLVHFSAQTLPTDYVSLIVTVSPRISALEIDSRSLPPDWAEEDPPLITRDLGSKWLQQNSSLLLKVPSAIIPTESNYLINPLHPDFAQLQIQPPVPFPFDPRLKQ